MSPSLKSNRFSDITSRFASALNMEPTSTDEVLIPIACSILLNMYRVADDSRRVDIERVRKEWMAASGLNTQDIPIKPVGLMGPPGNGQLTVFKAAAQKVAGALGMRYLELNAFSDLSQPTGNDDFLFVTKDVSVETAPAIAPLNEVPSFTGDRLVKLLQKLQKAGGGVILLDNFWDAAPVEQEAGLKLTDYTGMGGLSHITVGATGTQLDATRVPVTPIQASMELYLLDATSPLPSMEPDAYTLGLSTQSPRRASRP